MLAVERAVQSYCSWCREHGVRPDGAVLHFVIVSSSGLSLGLAMAWQDPETVSKHARAASSFALDRVREEGLGPPYAPGSRSDIDALDREIFASAHAVGTSRTTEALAELSRQFTIHMMLGLPKEKRVAPITETIGRCVVEMIAAPFDAHGSQLPEPPRR